MDKYLGMLLDNRYEILDIIGTGGMAVVYYARCRLLNRYVAIKILKDEYANDADFRRRFHTEAQAVAKLQHPNIVSVFDVNRTENVEYIVMELVDGITLKEYMEKKGALSTAEFLHFAPQIASALEHAHSRGVIHRDIKPQNMIILNDGSLKVTDFGIARFAKSPQNTDGKEALGSVHYVSPEQAKGSQIDTRSDIYSFGVMMYEMLTGRLPFEGNTPMEVVMKHINTIPPMPRELEPSIPVALEQMIMHAMAPRMKERYSSASEIIRDFERYQKNPNIVFPYKLPTEPADLPQDNASRFQKIREQTGSTATRVLSGLKWCRNSVEESSQTSPRKRTSLFVYIITAVLTAAVFLGGAAFIITTIFDTAVTAEEMSAPNLVGLRLEDVLSNAEYGSKYNIVEEASVYNADVEAGIILSQTPAKGRTIKSDTEIKVTVSLGAKEIMMPDLVNTEYRSAQLQLSEMELICSKRYEASETIAAGNIIRTEPEAKTKVVVGTEVTLVISIGRDEVMTKTPDLLGMTQAEAKTALEQNQLVLGEVYEIESREAVGTVVRQSVAKDVEVPEKTEVDIYISAKVTTASEPIQTSTSAPTEKQGTATLGLRLPSNQGDTVLVTIKSGSEILFEESYPASQGLINVELHGNGSVLAQVYYNNVFFSDQVLIFN